MRFDGDPHHPERPHDWDDWYRFARTELGFAHDEGAEYANLRFVEDRNRDALRGGGAAGDHASRPYD